MKKSVRVFEQTEDRPNSGTDLIMEVLDWLKYILIAVLIGLLLVLFVAQRNAVVGQSMAPTLHHNDQLLVEKVSKWFNGIEYGDIITINTQDLQNHDGTANIIKRVIGMPGDSIEVRGQAIYLNGELLIESYLADGIKTEKRYPEYGNVLLADDEYYVLGDNRDISLDSRTFGPVKKSDIIGKVLIRFYPFDHAGMP